MTTKRADDLSTNIAAFCALLRTEYGFSLGQAEAYDALRALETVGINDEARVRTALRLVCCATRGERSDFDRAFAAFFRPAAAGRAQPAYAPRHTRPSRAPAPPANPGARTPRGPASSTDELESDIRAPVERRPIADEPGDATAWRTLRARYSPSPAQATAPRLTSTEFEGMPEAAAAIIASVRFGRSRRWKRVERGGRFDLRRTIRASLQTGGEPVDLRFLGHPPRNPRFVVLVDGSRSMSERATAILHFARALCERTARANVFLFSTELRDVTRELRDAKLDGDPLPGLDGAWGGGTKIGASLDAFVARHGPRLLSPDTLVVVFSDGLDAGDIPQLERAMRTLERRSAGVVWLNPHADSPGYRPAARGMRAALPFITLLAAANDADGFRKVAARLAHTPRIAGRRR